MNTDKYTRQIALLCPTCGGSHFESSAAEDESPLKCAGCGRTLNRDELTKENQENIDAHLTEIGKQAIDDLTKEFQKSLANAFRGSRNIKFKQ